MKSSRLPRASLKMGSKDDPCAQKLYFSTQSTGEFAMCSGLLFGRYGLYCACVSWKLETPIVLCALLEWRTSILLLAR